MTFTRTRRRRPRPGPRRSKPLLLARQVLPGTAVAALALPKEASQLGGERLTRRHLLLLERIRALLQLLHVCGRLLVSRDRRGHLLRVRLGRFLKLVRVDRRVQDRPEPVAQREGRARAGRERDVVGNGRPQRDGPQPLPEARVVQDADDSGRALVPRPLEPKLL